MTRLRIGAKAQRVVEFLVGFGDPRVRRALAQHGLREEDIDEGWERLKALSKVPVRIVTEPASAELVQALDEWENQWFPIAEVVLRTSHPRAHELVFRNLRQAEGPEVVVTVRTLIERLALIARPEDEGGLGELGVQACEHLSRRGLSASVIDQARALLARVGRTPVDDEPLYDPEARAAAEAHLWSWYLEWSGIARAVIKNKRALASLGFRTGKKQSE